ncbi:hypothetical protein O3S81_04615 [Agrobacterium sp. SOY23]|uniref:hypothetical protein n=1 Tax=Agrobacterium sp. SOY23 TaxID=3014555 RepID=UPI0022B04930|nr:hypothetical protein [Agrobacterium sp. SOY23]MCZ4428975.1 hypothetical protein [Agrobacterium sp. SOY23]
MSFLLRGEKAGKPAFHGRPNKAVSQGKVNEINGNLTILANSGNYVFMALAVL